MMANHTENRIMYSYYGQSLEEADLPFVAKIRQTNMIVLLVGTFLMSVFGIPGNVLSIVVLQRQVLRDATSTAYLISLSFFNIITLIFAMARHFAKALVGTDIPWYSPIACGIVRWLTYVLIIVVSWHLVLISTMRLLFISKRTHCRFLTNTTPLTHLVVLCVSVGIIVAVIVFKAVNFVDHEGYAIMCELSVNFWAWMQFVLTSIAPTLLLFVLNGMLVFKHHSPRAGMMLNKSTLKVRAQMKLLVVISNIAFIVSLIPMGVFHVVAKKVFPNTSRGHAQRELGNDSVVLLMYMNNASNFLIYCFFGKKFRQELSKLLFGTRTKHPSLGGESTENPATAKNVSVDPADDKRNSSEESEMANFFTMYTETLTTEIRRKSKIPVGSGID